MIISISKIKQYNILRLAYIAVFKVIYKLYLYSFRLFLPKKWSIKNCLKGNEENYNFEAFITECDSNVDGVITEANQILSGKVVLFGTQFEINPDDCWLTDPVTKGEWQKDIYFVAAPVRQNGLDDVKYVLELNKLNHLVRVALAYHYTKKEQYIDHIIKSIEGYRKTILPYKSVCQRIIMDMGFRIINLIQISILCNDNKKYREQCAPFINGIIYDQVNAIRRFHTARWFKTGNGNNHVTGEMIGAIAGTLWLEHYGIKVRKCYSQYMSCLIDVLDRTVAPSGAYLEQSDNYARVVCEFLLFFDALTKIIPSSSLKLDDYHTRCYSSRLQHYVMDISYHDQLPNYGDNDDARVLIAWKPLEENVRYLIKESDRNNQSYLDGSTWTYRSEDKNDLYMFTRVGQFAFFKEATRIHSHNDLLSLVLGVRGQMIFVDKGCYLYNQGPEILRNDRSYSSHNTASVDGCEIDIIQSNGSFLQYPSSRCILSEINKDKCCFEGVLEYYGIKQTRRIEYEQNGIYIKDRFEGNEIADRQGRIRYILHKDMHAVVIDNEIIIKSLTEQSISLKIMFDGVDNFRLEKETYAPAFARKEETVAIVASFSAIAGKEYKTCIIIN